jgi:hypothetical protein
MRYVNGKSVDWYGTPKHLSYVRGTTSAGDQFMKLRLDCMKRNALRIRPALSATLNYSPNRAAAEKCRRVMALYDEAFGAMTVIDRIKSITVRILAARENYRLKKEGSIMRQPPTNRVTYPDRTFERARQMSQDETGVIAKTA